MDVLSFDIWGDYAYFRKGFSTTSTISYPFPSRTTIAGIIAGILGCPRDSYYDLFKKENSKIGLRIMNPIKKIRLNLNYTLTKDNIINLPDISDSSKRTQISAGFLKDVKYRIYVHLDNDSIMDILYNYLKNHTCVYTPCLGISECLANFEMVGDGFYSVNCQEDKFVDIDSVVLKSSGKIQTEKGKNYSYVKSPGFFNNDRSVSSFIEYFYEYNGSSINIDKCKYYKIGEDNVILF